MGGRWGKAWPVPAPSFDVEGGPIVVSADRGRLVDDICGLVRETRTNLFHSLTFWPRKIIYSCSQVLLRRLATEADADGRLAVSRGAREDQSTALCH